MKQIESISLQNQVKDLIFDTLKRITKLNNSIEINKLDCKAKSGLSIIYV